MSFAAILAGAQPAEGGFRVRIPETWHQGRTAYGGLSSALALVVAIRAGGEDLPPLASAQLAMIAPVAGEITVTAREVRRGRNVVWISAEIATEQGTALTASFAFQAPQQSALAHAGYAPPEALVPLDEAAAFASGLLPVFLREQFEIRFALPKGRVKQPEICWWVRLRDRSALDPQVEALLVADALPPGVMPLLDPRTVGSTMHWHCNFLTHQPTTRDGWWLLRSASDHARSGFSSEPRVMWNADLQPVMAGMQSVAVFG